MLSSASCVTISVSFDGRKSSSGRFESLCFAPFHVPVANRIKPAATRMKTLQIMTSEVTRFTSKPQTVYAHPSYSYVSSGSIQAYFVWAQCQS